MRLDADINRSFQEAVEAEGTVVVRAPGRVNLIGEHIDYNGLAVLPMAIQRGITLVARPRPDATVTIHDLDPAYGRRSFALADEIEPYPPADWGNYLKAAARMVARRYGASRGFDAVLGADLPPAAGLSSSSALVVATALALLRTNDLPVDRERLMEELAEAERYVGTRGGGMDQAICLAGREGHAALVEFDPLRVRHVAVPSGWRFLVASSLERAEKSGSAQAVYNRRTEECREALALVARRLKEPATPTYPSLIERHGTATLLEAGREALPDPLGRRFRHVVSEADRVRQGVAALERDDPAAFGRLMDASHASLRDDYEVSTPALDRIVALAREAGADGARLTGAGLGGCALVLCREPTTAPVRAALADRYASLPETAELEDSLYEVRPSSGASPSPTR